MLSSVSVSAIGIILALALYIFLIFKGCQQILCIMAATIFLALFSTNGFLTAFVTTFSEGAGSGFSTTFLYMTSGAILGGVMTATGNSAALGRFLIDKLGKRQAPLVVMLITFLCVLGGNGQYIFVVSAVACSVMSAANLPMYIAMMCSTGTGYLASYYLPGIVGSPNSIPPMLLGTTLYAGAGIGVVCFIVGILMIYFAARRLTKKAMQNGEGYVAPSFIPDAGLDRDDLPSLPVALLPILVVMIMAFVCIVKFGWATKAAVVCSQLAATVVMLITGWNRIRESKLKVIGDAALRVMPFICGMACITGFASVLSSCAAYQSVIDFACGLNMSPYITVVLATMIVVGITTDGIGGIFIMCQTVAPKLIEAGANASIVHRLICMASQTIDSLPHSGAMYMNLSVYGYTHKNGYRYLFYSTVVVTTVTSWLGAILATIFY